MKEIGKKIGIKTARAVIIIICEAIVGFLALYLVFCLPIERMTEHTYQSLPMLEEEFRGTLLFDYAATLPSNFTDCLMLEHAVSRREGHSILEQVCYMYRMESSEGPGWTPGYSLEDYLLGYPQPREVEYARYWHGYLLFLKPLLMITNFQTLRVFFAAVQLLLAGLVVMKCCQKKEYFLAGAFLASMPFLYFFALYASMSLSICFYIMTIAMIVQLQFDDKIESKGLYGEFFLIVGGATAYFDFLTYPLVTLGFPLCVYLFIHHKKVIEQVKDLASCTFMWVVGYIGLWAMKWVIVDIVAGGNVIQDGISTIMTRMSGVDEGAGISGYLQVLKLNMSVYKNSGFILFGLIILIWLIYQCIKQHKNINKEALLRSLMIWAVALYPFGWFLLTQNHSVQHWMYTCKIFTLSVFAVLCGVGKMLQGKNQSR